MHCGAVETRETDREAFTGGGEDIASPRGLEDHSDSKVTAHASEKEQIPTSDGRLSCQSMRPQHRMRSYNSDLSQDLSSAAPWRTAACTPPIFTHEEDNHCTDTETGCDAASSVLLPDLQLEEVSPEQVKLEPSQIKEEQEEVLLGPDQTSGSTLTLLAVKSEYSDENRETICMMDPTSFCCTVCGKVCFQKDVLNQHMGVHKGRKPFACAFCGKRFYYTSSLKRHVTIHTGKKPFACTVCKQSFACKTQLTIHDRIHTGGKDFACPFCCKTFSQTGLKTHLKQRKDKKKKEKESIEHVL